MTNVNQKLLAEYGKKLNEATQEQLRELLEEPGAIKEFVKGEFKDVLSGVIWALLGLERRFGDIDITRGSPLGVLMQDSTKKAAVELLQDALKLGIQLNDKQRKQLQRAYEDSYMGHLVDAVRDKAQEDAANALDGLTLELQEACGIKPTG